MKKMLMVCCVLSFPFATQAADIPTDQLQAQQYNRDACIKKQTDDCVNTLCPTSSDRNCPDNCAKSAQAKCQVQDS